MALGDSVLRFAFRRRNSYQCIALRDGVSTSKDVARATRLRHTVLGANRIGMECFYLFPRPAVTRFCIARRHERHQLEQFSLHQPPRTARTWRTSITLLRPPMLPLLKITYQAPSAPLAYVVEDQY